MAKKWNLIVDIERCDNCRSCYIAVKDEHAGNDFPGYAAAQPAQGHHWLDIRRKERGAYPLVEANFQPVMCKHCDDAPCMKAARDGAENQGRLRGSRRLAAIVLDARAHEEEPRRAGRREGWIAEKGHDGRRLSRFTCAGKGDFGAGIEPVGPASGPGRRRRAGSPTPSATDRRAQPQRAAANDSAVPRTRRPCPENAH